MATLIITSEGISLRAAPSPMEITLQSWREGVRPEVGRFALSIPNDEDVEALGDAVARFDGVILEFPDFKDGRAYSQARILRERLGFKGEVLARGAILCDQALFMARAGFDALDIGEGDAEGFRKSLSAYAHFYQPAADLAPTIASLRTTPKQAA